MTNTAAFKDSGSVEARFGSYGSMRAAVDANKVLIKGELALRIDLVDDKTQYQQDPAFNHAKRGYGAVRWEPKFLNPSWLRTKIQANAERGQVRSNNPRMLPPIDYVTGYLNDPRMSSTGYNLWDYSVSADGSGNTDLTGSYYTSNGSIGNWNQWGDGPQFYWDGATGKLLDAGQPNYSSPRGNGYGEPVNRYHVHSVGYNTYAKNANGVYRKANGGVDGGEFAGALGGSVNYFDQTLADRSIFDFFNKLIDGHNKREYQDWNSSTLNIVTGLFNNKLTFQGIVSREDFKSGQEAMLSNMPTVMLDLDRYQSTYPNWLTPALNPNLGRPQVFGSYGGGSRRRTEIDNYQFTTAYDLDFDQLLSRDSLIARILGRHQFTGLLSRVKTTQSSMGYKLATMDNLYSTTWAKSTRVGNNSLNWLAYLGPSMLGTTGSRSNLSNLSTYLPADTNQMNGMRVYDPTWTAGLSVDPTAKWSMPGANGTPVIRTQADNPANYRGWTRVPASVVTSQTHMDDMRTSSAMAEHRVDSKAIIYQGHFWDDTIIPSIGYREDVTRQRGNTAVQNDINGDNVIDSATEPDTGRYRLVSEITDRGTSAKTRSTSYGVAVHLPKGIKKNLSEGTDLSLYYFHGENEKPNIRYAIDGTELPNEKGITDDYSVQFDYRNRVSVRLTRFDTKSLYTQASYGSPLGANGWFIGAAPNWALSMGVAAMTAYELQDSAIPKGLRDNSWIYNWAREPERAALMPKIGEALKNEFTELYNAAYWERYGSNVDVDAIKRGDWLHVLKNTDVVLPWTITGIGDSIHGVTEIIDQDVQSKGYELEVTARPLKNWDLTFNVAKVDARQVALGEAATRHLEGMKRIFVDSAFGDVAMWGGYNTAGAWRSEFMKNLWAPYNVQKALTGSAQPEVRKWRYNIISNYTLDRSVVKGLNVGVGYRWEDRPTLGFGRHNADIGQGQTLWIADVNQPLYGDADKHVDLWMGYGRKLTKKIDWRLQVNVRSVGERTKLVPITLQANGDVAQARIQQGQTVDTTIKFSF